MQIISHLLICGTLFFSGATGSESDRSVATLEKVIGTADYLSPEEKAMLWEINLVRTEPETYLEFIEEELDALRADSVRLSQIVSESIRTRVTEIDGETVTTTDTTYRNYYEDRITAIRELIMDLGDAVPMPGLYPSQELYRAAVKHGDRQAPKAYIAHQGADGSWPVDRILKEGPHFEDGNENIACGVGDSRAMVIQLLIDSGVAHRGHRENILNPDWRYMTCHHVRSMDDRSLRWWIQEFAY